LYSAIAGELEGVRPSVVVCTAAAMSANVQQVLAETPQQFILLGTSFGGRVALETALAAPERVKGLVIIGSGAKAVADPAAGLRREARLRGGEFEQVVAEMADRVAHLAGPNGPATRQAFIDMAHSLGADAIANQAAAMARRADLTSRLGEVACPALMLWGKLDQFSPAADGLALSLAVQHGRYVEIPECGHFPSLEAPEDTVSALQHWLQDHHSLEA
jgi:pimeloyl-ACP methyl ester carboxylesterase